jgi:hypothetical protein
MVEGQKLQPTCACLETEMLIASGRTNLSKSDSWKNDKDLSSIIPFAETTNILVNVKGKRKICSLGVGQGTGGGDIKSSLTRLVQPFNLAPEAFT